MVRVLLLTLLSGSCLLGCNSDPRCRRETALLRSEILDLEDKYYMAKAQRDDAIAALENEGKLEPARRIRERFINESIPKNEEIYYGEAVYSPLQYDSPNDSFTDQVISSDWSDGTPPQTVSPQNTTPRSSPGTSLRSPEETITPRSTAPRSTAPRSTAPRSTAPRSTAPRGTTTTPRVPQSRETGNPGKPQAEPDGSMEEIPSKSIIDPPDNSRSNGSRFGKPDNNRTKSEKVSSSNLVTEIVIDKDQTYIKSMDGEQAGIVLCLLPRDANGRSREVNGELTVSVIDPSATSSAQRLGIWKFMPIELELFYESVDERKKMVLDLPFEDAQPVGKEVVVMVRFQTEDGRVLETTNRIKTKTAAGGNPSPPIKIDHGDNDLRAEKPQWRPVR